MLSEEFFNIMKESNIERFTFKGNPITLIQSDNAKLEVTFVFLIIVPFVLGLTLYFINTFIIIPYIFQIGALIYILAYLFALFFPICKVTYEVSLNSPMTSEHGSFIKKVGTSDYSKKILSENTFIKLSKSERSNFVSSLKEEIKKEMKFKRNYQILRIFFLKLK